METTEKQAHHFVLVSSVVSGGTTRETSIPLLVSSVVPTITRIEQRRYSGNALVTQAIDSILCAVSVSVGFFLPTRALLLFVVSVRFSWPKRTPCL